MRQPKNSEDEADDWNVSLGFLVGDHVPDNLRIGTRERALWSSRNLTRSHLTCFAVASSVSDLVAVHTRIALTATLILPVLARSPPQKLSILPEAPSRALNAQSTLSPSLAILFPNDDRVLNCG